MDVFDYWFKGDKMALKKFSYAQRVEFARLIKEEGYCLMDAIRKIKEMK